MSDAAQQTWVQKRLAELPSSFDLARACAMWPPSPQRDARVRAAAEAVDWQRFQKVLVRQRIGAQARAALDAAGVAPPPEVAEFLARHTKAVASRNLLLAAEALRLRRMMADAGIEALFIKGAALAELAYGDQSLKHCRDIDMLVAPSQAERAFDILLGAGYVNIAPPGVLDAVDRAAVFRLHKDIELMLAAGRVNLELHWRLIDNAELLKSVGAASPSQEVAVLGGRLATLADPELFAYLCVHGATHGWFRLKWLADLNAWLSHKTPAEVTAFHQRARTLGVDACANQALALCRDVLGYAPPPALAAELDNGRTRFLSRAALRAMTGGDGEVELNALPLGTFQLLPPQFFRGRGFAVFAAQCGLLIESLDDRLTYKLPRPIAFLYPVLRLPFWVVRVARRRAAARAPVKAAGAGA